MAGRDDGSPSFPRVGGQNGEQALCHLEHTHSCNNKARERTSELIKFNKALPVGDALCPRLFTICLNPVAWQLTASEGYKLSKPISAKITDLLYTDDLKVFAASAGKMTRVLKAMDG